MGKGRKSERWITHYSSSHKILLVGEGDFSFSSCLARSFGSAQNMVATSFDSKDELREKHWSSVEHLQELKRLGCTVLHDVDVHDMHEHAILSEMKFDRIVYNFPHAGHDPMFCERHPELIRRHKELLAAFFTSSREMISEDGEIHVSHRDDEPYIRWKLEKSARKAGLTLIDKVEFFKADYPGYHNKRGGGMESNKTFPLKDCYTFKFSLPKCSETDEGSSTSDGDLQILTKMFSQLQSGSAFGNDDQSSSLKPLSLCLDGWWWE
ncbi:uncharacterized protein M6B38_407505 [Iris pallida]|uniref:25S rRNA (uridine-N(3))-methyltransferase BMT5-like domain-containing protein n=1 Tax=Iris pallida TaxID=29817 RepID=A0AAX6E8U2_IRIPA|nr:uncharacterized protein M6B38_200675 [Iris pallida]KAJ6818170.1 uncharacterized protein M6B38_407505 [Iris pallida]